MRRTSTTLERFLRRVHRRWIFLRALEAAGVGAGIGCAAALALVPVLLWRDQPALSVSLVLIAVTGAAGLIFGLTRRPTLLAAAVEADRQLALHDLLASALASRDVADEWGGAVVAQAEARCRDLSPDAILLNRLGVRAWSGIGLAAALVMTLSLLSSQPEPLIASNSTNTARRSTSRAPVVQDVPAATDSRDRNASRASAPTDSSRDPLAAPDRNVEDPSASTVTSADNMVGSSSGSTGTGLGAARTDDAGSRDVAAARDPSAGQRDPSTVHDGNRDSTAGAGAAALTPGGRGDVTGTGGSPSNARVAPWSSPTWADAQRHARDAVENGRVPDHYRDLIRSYFEPEPQ